MSPRPGFRLLLGLLLIAVLVLPSVALAAVHSFTIDGDEAQATTCSVGSTSRIVGTATYDDVSGLFSWSYTYGDNAPAYDNGALFAGGTETIAHFHGPAAPGVPANVRVGTGTGNPNIGSATISSAFGTELLSNLWYLNVHSSSCGGGEMRGQVLLAAPPVPSVSIPLLGVLVAGLVGVAVWTTRRSAASA